MVSFDISWLYLAISNPFITQVPSAQERTSTNVSTINDSSSAKFDEPTLHGQDAISKSVFLDGFWSTKPKCSRHTKGQEEYCVFTSGAFANGRGLSILSTPRHAQEIVQLPAFANPSIHRSMETNQLSDPPFVVKEIENHGTGVIARRSIQRGETLMSFTPAFMREHEVQTNLHTDVRLAFQRYAFEQLPNTLRNAAKGLFGQSSEDVDLIDDILDTNSFALSLVMTPENESVDDDEDVEFDLLFPEIARFNHDCRPTADYFFDASTLTLNVVAHRDVLPGEELTISYIDPLQRRRERRKALKKSWGFTCDCPLCTASPETIETSDNRIGKIQELREELEDRSKESEADPTMAEQLIRLLKQERLYNLMFEGYMAASFEYNGVGDSHNAKKYASLAMERGSICRGPDDVDSNHRAMRTILEEPRRHPSWMFRLQNHLHDAEIEDF